MDILLKLFLVFWKIGTFAFGGGMAMLPLIEREVVTNYHWISKETFIDIIGISQMTPGPIAINSATFVGFTSAGIVGALAATSGVVLTSFILVSVLHHFVSKFKDSKLLKASLLGMRPAIIALIFSVFIKLSYTSYRDITGFIIASISLFLLFKKTHPILVILISATLGIILY
ncbi:chromate transporter [Oceanirhabdus sp. W0125-5]|uniref:chromate transporter n=1 Tax=Oceanirhabdus sp. W0125-5 TaxID=2999116 RepID=UPI0022F3104C|nr:chromate transporter [Oceanirhabdus sp. W0125-5]WBW98727.1 chromate transporter [Oceanirhabdus sp. W0125-5]